MIDEECEVMRRMDVEMNSQAENAEKLFSQGYNCAQSVFLAFHDEMEGIDREAALRIMSSFGGGLGRLREVCGALTGLFAAVGILYGYSDPDDREGKAGHYRLIQELGKRFKDEFGSILCRDLLDLEETVSDPTPEPRTQAYYQTRPCAEYIRFGAALLESLIKERQKD
jgi:C_GCAxxG_C_C family probable redox protein